MDLDQARFVQGIQSELQEPVQATVVSKVRVDSLQSCPQHFFTKRLDEDILMSASSHIQSVLIVFECRNCRQTLDAYLLFAIWIE